MENRLDKLNFKESKAQIKDKSTLFTAFQKIDSKKDPYYSRKEILLKMERLAGKVRQAGKNAFIGMACHYEFPNSWTPAIYCDIKKRMVLYNPIDSDTSSGFKNIDEVYSYVVEGKELDQQFHTVKKANNEVDRLLKTQSFFSYLFFITFRF